MEKQNLVDEKNPQHTLQCLNSRINSYMKLTHKPERGWDNGQPTLIYLHISMISIHDKQVMGKAMRHTVAYTTDYRKRSCDGIPFCSQLGVRRISDYSPARTMDDCTLNHKDNYVSTCCNVSVITGRIRIILGRLGKGNRQLRVLNNFWFVNTKSYLPKGYRFTVNKHRG